MPVFFVLPLIRSFTRVFGLVLLQSIDYYELVFFQTNKTNKQTNKTSSKSYIYHSGGWRIQVPLSETVNATQLRHLTETETWTHAVKCWQAVSVKWMVIPWTCWLLLPVPLVAGGSWVAQLYFSAAVTLFLSFLSSFAGSQICGRRLRRAPSNISPPPSPALGTRWVRDVEPLLKEQASLARLTRRQP